ncbi:hypothetical protein J6D68_001304 [Salmonella enterica subsp. enterica]|nr:hypothetical protein [Salmonella enterica subsp. enterica]
MNNKLTDDVLEYVLAVVEDRYDNRKSNAGEDDRIILALRELQERRKADSDDMSAGNYCYHYKAEGENGCYAGVANVSYQVVDWNTFQAFKITVGRLNGDKITSITSLSFLGEVNKS